MWTVHLTIPGNTTYKQGHFPRQFRYKQDALAVKKAVERAGGEVVITSPALTKLLKEKQ